MMMTLRASRCNVDIVGVEIQGRAAAGMDLARARGVNVATTATLSAAKLLAQVAREVQMNSFKEMAAAEDFLTVIDRSLRSSIKRIWTD